MVVEELYNPCSETKCADQMCGIAQLICASVSHLQRTAFLMTRLIYSQTKRCNVRNTEHTFDEIRVGHRRLKALECKRSIANNISPKLWIFPKNALEIALSD